MARIVCVSDCCCDLIFGGLAKIPAPGTEEYCESLGVMAGGGANTPMGLARLGCETVYLTAVGEDLFGDIVRQQLANSGVSMELVQRVPGGRTWVSAVLSTKQDRSFASFAGTAVELREETLEQALKGARHLHTYLYYARRFPDLLPLCKSLGVTVSLDATWEEGQTLADIEPVLRQADLFLPNDREAMGLTGEPDAHRALEVLGGVCPYTVVTMGGEGAIAAKGGRTYQVSAAKAGEPVDFNGAGDLFNAGLLWAMAEGKPVEEQLRAASASGGLAVTYAGGMSDLYTRQRVEELAATVKVEVVTQ